MASHNETLEPFESYAWRCDKDWIGVFPTRPLARAAALLALENAPDTRLFEVAIVRRASHADVPLSPREAARALITAARRALESVDPAPTWLDDARGEALDRLGKQVRDAFLQAVEDGGFALPAYVLGVRACEISPLGLWRPRTPRWLDLLLRAQAYPAVDERLQADLEMVYSTGRYSRAAALYASACAGRNGSPPDAATVARRYAGLIALLPIPDPGPAAPSSPFEPLGYDDEEAVLAGDGDGAEEQVDAGPAEVEDEAIAAFGAAAPAAEQEEDEDDFDAFGGGNDAVALAHANAWARATDEAVTPFDDGPSNEALKAAVAQIEREAQEVAAVPKGPRPKVAVPGQLKLKPRGGGKRRKG
jgi:hypothetical protein